MCYYQLYRKGKTTRAYDIKEKFEYDSSVASYNIYRILTPTLRLFEEAQFCDQILRSAIKEGGKKLRAVKCRRIYTSSIMQNPLYPVIYVVNRNLLEFVCYRKYKHAESK